jgi:hypothetical protein
MRRALAVAFILLALLAEDGAWAQFGSPAPGEAPGAPSMSPAPEPRSSAAPASKKKTGKKRRKARAVEPADEDAEARRVWTETDSAKVKTIYDDQGNIVYQKAWDKDSGREVPVPDAAIKTSRLAESGRDFDSGIPAESRPYGRLRGGDEEGEYGEEGYGERPRYRRHGLHHYKGRPSKHPYEFSLSLAFWSNLLTGKVKGTAGEGTIQDNRRNTYMADFVNQRAGFAVGQTKHTAQVDGTFTFRGVTFPGAAILDQDFVFYDSFFRFGLYSNPDLWIDWSIGLQLIQARATITGGGSSASINTLVPLPTLGLMGRYNLLDNVHMRGFLRGLAINAGKAAAVSVNSEFEVVYTFPGDEEYSRFNQFSVGYKFLMLNVKSDKGEATEGEADLTFHGPYAKFSAYF